MQYTPWTLAAFFCRGAVWRSARRAPTVAFGAVDLSAAHYSPCCAKPFRHFLDPEKLETPSFVVFGVRDNILDIIIIVRVDGVGLGRSVVSGSRGHSSANGV